VARSKVELFEAIRRDDRVEQLSVRALSDKYGVHRRTVRQALENAVPPERKTPVRVAPKLEPAKRLIDAMLTEDLTAPRKQRHTARRVLARLVDEHELTDLTYSAVRDYVAKRRPQIWAAAGKGLEEAFLEGHQAAFEVFGGTPMFHIRYDNLKAAVSRVLFGRTRTESTRWVAFRSHHGFEAFYCHPGVEGAHEKGGVEGEGGRFRRNHLVPVPKVDTMAELNVLLTAYDLADETRRISNRTLSVGQHFTFEASLLRPLPPELFQTGLVLTPRVDRYSRVTVRQCFYSVPARLIGHQIRGVLHASELVLFSGRNEVARHERSTIRGSETLVLDHYLEVLVRKPGALRGATALVQARAAGTFTSTHEAFWAAARKAHGDSGGTRVLVEVLLLHRHHTDLDVVAGITAALKVGAVSPDVVALETRKHAQQQAAAGAAAAAIDPVVVNLQARRLTDLTDLTDQLPPDLRPPPSVAAYDSLLTGTRDT
jgi:transposase